MYDVSFSILPTFCCTRVHLAYQAIDENNDQWCSNQLIVQTKKKDS